MKRNFFNRKCERRFFNFTAESTSSEEDIIKSISQSGGGNTDDNINNGRFTQETEQML